MLPHEIVMNPSSPQAPRRAPAPSPDMQPVPLHLPLAIPPSPPRQGDDAPERSRGIETPRVVEIDIS